MRKTTKQRHPVATPSSSPAIASHPVKAEPLIEQSSRKATGPRTLQGKQRVKFNALKHGLFSKAVLLEGESVPKFKSLLNGLREDWRPLGESENVLVEYLAVLLWRKRRGLEVERAEISKGDFLGEESFVTQAAQALDYVRFGERSEREPGSSDNLCVIRDAINILDQVRIGLEASDLEKRKGTKFFRLLFPLDQDGAAHGRMVRVIHEVSKLVTKFNKGKEITEDPDHPNRNLCQAIQAEKERLSELHEFAMCIEAKKIRSNVSAARIPCQEVLDRFLRNDAHTSREIDRTMRQLERLRRMREGSPPPPQLEVNIS